MSVINRRTFSTQKNGRLHSHFPEPSLLYLAWRSSFSQIPLDCQSYAQTLQ